MRLRRLRNYLVGPAVLLAIILTLFLCISSVAAAGTTTVSVSAPAQPVSPGQQFTVNISVQPGSAIAGAQFDLSFDPSLVSVNSVTEGNLLNQNGAGTYFMPGTINNTAGTVTGVAGAITSPGQTVSTAGTLAVITMTASASGGTCPLNLSSVVVGDINGQSLTVSTASGQVVVDQAPVLASIGNKTVNEGSLLSFTISATDPDGDTLTYSASNLPSGATFNTSTRTFSWTPTYTQAGSYTGVHFQVSDGTLTDSENITITVNNVDRAPVLASIGNKTVNEGSLLSFTISATDPDGDTLTYSASNLPSGATFNASTRTFSWTPASGQAGTYSNVHFQVSDGTLTDSENITITVNAVYPAWDVNQDGSINVLDMNLIGQHWGETGTAGWIPEDVNSDGSINVLDMILVGQHWSP